MMRSSARISRTLLSQKQNRNLVLFSSVCSSVAIPPLSVTASGAFFFLSSHEIRYHTAMPELPEVETIVRALTKEVRGKRIRRVEVESPKIIRPLSPTQFRRAVVGRVFANFERRGKFILVRLSAPRGRSKEESPRFFLLWHMGMTGHPLYRDPKAEAQNRRLAAAFQDPMNRHVRLTFHFSDGTRLEYADVRKFGKVEFFRGTGGAEHPQLARLGPEVLTLARRPREFLERIKSRNTALKVALMDQHVLAGVGNIYADETLWVSRLHPLLSARSLTPAQGRALAGALRRVLSLAIRAHGTSVDDFRRVRGTKGAYGDMRKVYRRAGLPCSRCGTLIERLVVGGRGTHVCPRCQTRDSW